MKRKSLYFLIYITFSILVLSIGVLYAFLSDTGSSNKYGEIGLVDVSLDVYFIRVDELGNPIKIRTGIEYDVIASDEYLYTKSGVVKVNLSSRTEEAYIENLRVDVIVKSTVDTYFRVAPFEQLTIKYTIGDVTREVAATQKGYMNFNYGPQGNFYNNRIKDGYYYYESPVRRNGEDNPLVISLIGSLPEDEFFEIYDPKYSLQIGFIVEAVQARNDGPKIIWGLNKTPWGSEWNEYENED